ncbi:MAG: hypothetical protein H3C47_08205 [Candidatus Cloacimonetes bacterium]|nr:hypothetical protein [Candidatus Cloacimonadota bacterium]
MLIVLVLLLPAMGYSVSAEDFFGNLHQTTGGSEVLGGTRSGSLSEVSLSRLNQNSFDSGNILLAQSTAPSRGTADYFIGSKRGYLVDAARRTIEQNVKFLRKHKFFEIGDILKFQKFAYAVNDVFPLEKYSGDSRHDVRAIAVKDPITLSTSPKIFIYLKYYDAIDSKFEYRELSQKEIDQDVWHELIHVYEFLNPEQDKKFAKYDKSGLFQSDVVFAERHASFFDDMIKSLGPLSKRVEDGRGTLFSIKSPVIRIFEVSYNEFWKDWPKVDVESDLSLFYRNTGIKFDIDKIRAIDENSESLLYKKHWYDVGYITPGGQCSNISRLADRNETSDIETTLHTIRLPINKTPHEMPEKEIYITPGFREKISREYPSATSFCIVRKMP